MTAALPALTPAFANANGRRPRVALIVDSWAIEPRTAMPHWICPRRRSRSCYARHSTALAEGAATFDHEVMLRMPMQATNEKFTGLSG